VARAGAIVAETSDALETRGLELHEIEKAIVAFEAQVSRSREETVRLERKGDVLATERRKADEEIHQLNSRESEARTSSAAMAIRRQEAEGRLDAGQRRLGEARERVEARSQRVAEARAAHAALVERAAALAAEVVRLDEAARELESRLEARTSERAAKIDERAALDVATAEALGRLDRAVVDMDALRQHVRSAEEAAAALRARVDDEETAVRQARRALDDVRAAAGALEIARATSESDLSHLAATCVETVQASLDEVVAEVALLEQTGEATPDSRALEVGGSDEDEDEQGQGGEEVKGGEEAEAATPPRAITAEEAIVGLRTKIDRLGPVNMMAIEQFDELETRHQFLTTQRKDLVDSIAATNEAIKRIDETSKIRFHEAFVAINLNFQQTFSTLFGGGHAGLTLLDEGDPLESGIDIVASPPGKRLQSVQLLSGGEKALTAIALMFAIFKYKPSPFCLLDEIDAPLDDANIGRFVEMLKGLLQHTQFILITHNRKTMEIADRLYGVTMEEPGVSKLISVRLN
jgi:chromosome segregation protein